MIMRAFSQLLLILFICSNLSAEKLSMPLNADAAILINAKNGAILFEKNADAQLFPASITKVATALYILKKYHRHLDEIVTVKREAIASITPDAKRQSNYRSPPYWLETDATHAGIKKGEEISVKNLLYLMLVASANDAANVLAEHFGGTIPKFMDGLNSYLRELGIKQTRFLNPHGLHHPDQVTTAREMALIAKEAMKIPVFREIVSQVQYTVPRTNLEFERPIIQTNLLLRKGRYRYPQAIGVKTGTTTAAGKTLVAAAVDDGRELLAVVLGCQKIGERFDDTIKMFDQAFAEQKMRRYLFPAGPVKLTKKVMGAKGRLKTHLPLGLYYDFFPTEEVAVKASVKWLIPKLPISKGQCVGIVRVQDLNGNILQEAPILAAENVAASLFYRIKQLFFGTTGRKIFFLGLSTLALFFILKLRKKKRARYL